MEAIDAIDALPDRAGPRPETGPAMPHQQLTQNAPPEWQEALLARAAGLPGVRVGRSGVSVPGARAFLLDEELAHGPLEAFMVGTEFAHLHPPYDGSLHLAVPAEMATELERKGWGELHPLARLRVMPPTGLMLFGPRDAGELEVAWTVLRVSYGFARGDASPAGGHPID